MQNFDLQVIDTFSLEIKGKEEMIREKLSDDYRTLNIDYARFYKMNSLCKLGFLGSEKIISKNVTLIKSTPKDKIATIFFNKSSSLVSDYEHRQSLGNDILPSPSVFVYTLPNILNGEIAIRNSWTGYNAFYILDKYDEVVIKDLIVTGRYGQPFDLCLAAWVETDLLHEKFSLITTLYKVS